MSESPALWGHQHILYLGLRSQADTKLLQTNPTLAAGDVTISKDGGTAVNLATLPTVTPAGGKRVKVTISATEMQAENVSLVFSDAAGAEWADVLVNLQPQVGIIRRATGQAGSTTTTMKLDASASTVDQIYRGALLLITAGTGVGQPANTITDYNGTTKVAEVGYTWITTPDATSVFEIHPGVGDGALARNTADLAEANMAKQGLYTAVQKGSGKYKDDGAGSAVTYRSDGTTAHATQAITTDSGLVPIKELGVPT